jgi:hypothetical protein
MDQTSPPELIAAEIACGSKEFESPLSRFPSGASWGGRVPPTPEARCAPAKSAGTHRCCRLPPPEGWPPPGESPAGLPGCSGPASRSRNGWKTNENNIYTERLTLPRAPETAGGSKEDDLFNTLHAHPFAPSSVKDVPAQSVKDVPVLDTLACSVGTLADARPHRLLRGGSRQECRDGTQECVPQCHVLLGVRGRCCGTHSDAVL